MNGNTSRRNRFKHWISRRLDWRVGLVAAVWVVSCLATYFFYVLVGYGLVGGDWLKPETLKGAIFGGWISGLATFTAVGIAAALVSLSKPEHESFDARARILFGRKSGKHIDYIVEKLKDQLAHYSRTTDVCVTVTAYDKGEDKVRLAEKTEFTFNSYVEDVVSTFVAKFSYSELTAPPQNCEPNKLSYFRINGAPLLGAQTIQDRFDYEYNVSIEPHSDTRGGLLVEYWTTRTEENTFDPVRYTQSVQLRFENNIPEEVEITIEPMGGAEQKIPLKSGARLGPMTIKDVPPGSRAYVFWIGALGETKQQ